MLSGVALNTAHGSPVTAITALGSRVWTSGGRGGDARLREWSLSGALHADVDLSCTGAPSNLISVDRMMWREVTTRVPLALIALLALRIQVASPDLSRRTSTLAASPVHV